MDDISYMKYQIHHSHLKQYVIKQKHDLISKMYVGITGSLLQLVYIHWVRKYPKFVDSYSRVQQYINWHLCTNTVEEIYVINMCICHLFIDSSISVSNSQHSMLAFYKVKNYLLKKQCQGKLPRNMLASLIYLNIFVSDIYLDDISSMKCQIHHSHLEKYFIQQKHDINYQHLC